MTSKRVADANWGNDRPTKRVESLRVDPVGTAINRSGPVAPRHDERGQGEGSKPNSGENTPKSDQARRTPDLISPTITSQPHTTNSTLGRIAPRPQVPQSPTQGPVSTNVSQSSTTNAAWKPIASHPTVPRRSPLPPKSPVLQDPAKLLAELLSLAGEIALARFAENVARKEVARCEMERNHAAEVQNFPTFLEVKHAALLRSKGDLALNQTTVEGLLSRQAILTTHYNEAIGYSKRATREDELSTMIATTVAAQIKSVVDIKDQEIESFRKEIGSLKKRIEQGEANRVSETAKKSSAIEVLRIKLGDKMIEIHKFLDEKMVEVHKFLNDKLNEQERKIGQVDNAIKTTHDKYEVLDQRISKCEAVTSSTYIVRKEFEQFSARVDGAITVLKEKNETYEMNSSKMAPLQVDVKDLQNSMKTLHEDVKQIAKTSPNMTSSSNEDIEKSLSQQIQDVKKELEQQIQGGHTAINLINEELGDENNSGIIGDLTKFEERLNVLETQLRNPEISVPTADRNPEASVPTEAILEQMRQHVEEQVNSARDALQGKLQNFSSRLEQQMEKGLIELSDRFDKQTEEQVEKVEEDMSVELASLKERFDQQHTILNQVHELGTRLDRRLQLAEESLEKQSSTEGSLTDRALLGVTQLGEKHMRMLEIRTQDWLRSVNTRLEVVEESSRFLQDRYDNTTSDSVVNAMCQRLRTNFGYEPNQRQINTANHQELGRLWGNFQKLEPQVQQIQNACTALRDSINQVSKDVGTMGKDLGGKVDTNARHSQNNATIIGLLQAETKTLKDNVSTAKTDIDTLKTDVSDWNHERTTAVERFGKMNAEIEGFGKRLGTIESNGVLEKGEELQDMPFRQTILQQNFASLRIEFERLESSIKRLKHAFKSNEAGQSSRTMTPAGSLSTDRAPVPTGAPSSRPNPEVSPAVRDTSSTPYSSKLRSIHKLTAARPRTPSVTTPTIKEETSPDPVPSSTRPLSNVNSTSKPQKPTHPPATPSNAASPSRKRGRPNKPQNKAGGNGTLSSPIRFEDDH